MSGVATPTANDLADRLRRHWGTGIEALEVSPRRVRGHVHRQFHVAIAVDDPTRVTLTGWDRDLSDLIAPNDDDETLLVRVEAAMRSAQRGDALAPPPRAQRDSGAGGWAARHDAALHARTRRDGGERVGVDRMTADGVADLVREVWPGAPIERHEDHPGRQDLSVRPYSGDRVVVGLTPRGTLVAPVADGETIPLPGGRSSITDGSRSQVLSALQAADEWLRTTAPADGILARAVIR